MTSTARTRPVLSRLYEWGVATDVRGRPRLLPAGVTSQALQARALMLEALGAVPGGMPATGWVTEVEVIRNGFDRRQTSVLVMRDASGTVRWLTGEGGG